jgi:hypothetical protein
MQSQASLPEETMLDAHEGEVIVDESWTDGEVVEPTPAEKSSHLRVFPSQRDKDYPVRTAGYFDELGPRR